MSPDADLYIDRMDLASYRGGEVCELCKVDSFEELVERIKAGRTAGGLCPHWPEWRRQAFDLAVRAGEVLPSVPSIDVPRPVDAGMLELNHGGPGSPLLVTGNSEFTQAVMLAVLSGATAPIRMLTVDTRGHTVDMAMVFKELTVEKIMAALDEYGALAQESKPRLILPGLAASLADRLAGAIEATVEVGPVCAAEIPLYLGEAWG